MEQLPVFELPEGSTWSDVIALYHRARSLGLPRQYAGFKVRLPASLYQPTDDLNGLITLVQEAVNRRASRQTNEPMISIKWVS